MIEAQQKPVMIDGWPTVPLSDDRHLTWADVFNSGHRTWGYITYAQEAAAKASYPFFVWSGRVFHTISGHYAGVLESEL